ncbi:hypothetical protein [Actinopolyspora erythraea]|uniref:hypothetical protein n=1 Tax=Actinopolyspora erythraea TaxID=414996 RepID=UPI001CB7AA7F|nr:hypothetical protein [Actinopolyspora erythraea]
MDSEFGHVLSILIGQSGNPSDRRDEIVLDVLDLFAVVHVFSRELVSEEREIGLYTASGCCWISEDIMSGNDD